MSQKNPCPNCGTPVSPELLLDIRGRVCCLHCQLNFLWDFVEGTRRMIESVGGSEPETAPEPQKSKKIPRF